MPNVSEPLGLPNGSVRALLAVMLTGASIYLWVTGQVVPTELLLLAASALSLYFGNRLSTSKPEASPAPVYIPDEPAT